MRLQVTGTKLGWLVRAGMNSTINVTNEAQHTDGTGNGTLRSRSGALTGWIDERLTEDRCRAARRMIVVVLM